MTNYIELMMETAGCKEKPCPKDEYDELCKKYEFCNNAPHCVIYPDFTATKQLELIKLIVEDNVIGFFKITQGLSKDYILFYEGCKSQNKDFTQALAQLITELMNASELDKEEVKEILYD